MNSRRVVLSMRMALITAALCVSVVGGKPAAAAGTTVTFAGTVTSLSAGYEVPGIEVGDTIFGSLDYDPYVSDSQSIDWIGLYRDAITRFSAQIGDQTFSMVPLPASPRSEIDVLNNDLVAGTYYDSLYFRVAVEDAAAPEIARFLQLTFSVAAANPPAVLPSDALPASFNPSAFAVRSGFVTDLPPDASQGSNFVLTEVAVTPVPEPERWHLLAAGMTLLLAMRYRGRMRRPS